MDAYIKTLKDHGAFKLYFKALKEKNQFDLMTENMDIAMNKEQELPDMRADLDEYCKNIEGEKLAAALLKQTFEQTEHDCFIKDIVQYLILN